MRKLLMACLLAGLLISCSKPSSDKQETVRAMYYWNTVFQLDSVKKEFMRKHRVERLYVRYFDVVMSDNGKAVPNATIQFDSVADCGGCEVVPTVFIHNDCMRQADDELPEKLLKRILQMSETHAIGKVKEIQIDCDWTKTTQEQYFGFLRKLKERMQEMPAEGITLSTTIRLHQLQMPVPPVDKGTLMVYNTGDLSRLDVEKPILDYNDVKPYLKHLKNYALPLISAYPIYRWELLFRNRKFVGILHSDDELPVLKSDSVVTRQPTADDIISCKQAIESIRDDCGSEIILFDLNNYNIKRYTNEEFENFYH